MPASNFGTITTLDTLAAMSQTVAEIGEDTVWNVINQALEIHNRILNEQLAQLVEPTTQRLKRYGGAASMEMQELDQLGTPYPQKVTTGATVGLPLRLYGSALQWTRKALQVMPASEIAAQTNAMMDGDKVNISRQLKRAIFIPTNYTFEDVLIDDVELDVKRLINADGSNMPLGPEGQEFNPATHTHYLAVDFGAATSQQKEDAVVNLIKTVIEHYGAGNVYLYVNEAQEGALKAMTGKFTPYTIPQVTLPDTVAQATGVQLNPLNSANRAIGVFDTGAAQVWVKPWIPANYMFCFIQGQRKPVAMRTRAAGSGNLVLVFDDEAHPLRARGYEREFGMGVWERTNGAVLYIGGGTYTAPTIT